jgi:hypothetical protein
VKNKITLELHKRKKDGKYKATTDTLEQMKRATAEKLYFEQVTENKARSSSQNRYYRGVVLPVFCANVEGMEKYTIDNGNGKYDYEPAHRYLLLRWAEEKNHYDLIKIVPFRDKDGDIIEGAMVSFSFDNCSHELACEFVEYVCGKFFKKVGVSIEECVHQQST